ncbi:MAG TPA: low temperature requirement protein A [Streptosporangiaceae bacterium]
MPASGPGGPPSSGSGHDGRPPPADGPVSGHASPDRPPGGTAPASAPAAGRPRADGAPLRVSTLELFFDLVFAFTLTQLTALLASHLSVTGVAQVLLIFGVLWWMYGGYAWLTNTRTPDRTPERLLLLLGMAGFLVVGLAIPHGFAGEGMGAAGGLLGLGYLVVVLVHASLYYRLNRNIMRIAPFNVTSALLVILAGVADGPAVYALWAAALAIQVLSPLIASPGGRFEIRPAHFVERHGALIIVALGESVAALGISAARQGATGSLAGAAVLGLALTACLWWVYFGTGDDDRAERAFTAADPARRPGLALSAYFFAHIPMLLGVVAMAAGVKLTLGHPGQPEPVGQALVLSGGVALFLAGDAWFRSTLRLGPPWPRLATAGVALAAAALGATVTIDAQLAVLLAVLVAMLALERRIPAVGGTSRATAPRARLARARSGRGRAGG